MGSWHGLQEAGENETFVGQEEPRGTEQAREGNRSTQPVFAFLISLRARRGLWPEGPNYSLSHFYRGSWSFFFRFIIGNANVIINI